MRVSLALSLAAAPLLPLIAAQAQATEAPASSATAASSESSTSAYTGTPTINLMPSSTMTACQEATIEWRVYGDVGTGNEVDLYVYDIGVEQSASAASPAPVATSSSSSSKNEVAALSPPKTEDSKSENTPATTSKPATPAPVESRAAVSSNKAANVARDIDYLNSWANLASRDGKFNVTIIKDWPATRPAVWTPNLPAGRYELLARVHGGKSTFTATSSPFTIVQSANSTCTLQEGNNGKNSGNGGVDPAGSVNTAEASPSPSSDSNSSADSNKDNGGNNTTTDSEGQAAASKKSGISGGAIAGIVIGVLAGVAILAMLVFCCMRRKRNDSGGRKNLIGSPSNFRKVRRGTSGRSSRFGLPLSGRGISNNDVDANGNVNGHHSVNGYGTSEAKTSNADSYDMEKAVPYPAPVAAPLPARSQSAMSRESENPFETAPSTPVEETSGNGIDTAAFGAASAAAARAVHRPQPGYVAEAHYPPNDYPESMSQSPTERASETFYSPDAEQAAYSQQSPHSAHSGAQRSEFSSAARYSGPQPMPSLPSTPATPRQTYSYADDPPAVLAPAFIPSHKSARSAGSAREAMNADGAGVPNSSSAYGGMSQDGTSPTLPPSSYHGATSPGSPRGPERKTSLRRKPVPKLVADEDSKSDSNGSPTGSEQSHNYSRPRLGPPSDQFGLGAALDGADLNRGLSFKLMPDPPLPQDD